MLVFLMHLMLFFEAGVPISGAECPVEPEHSNTPPYSSPFPEDGNVETAVPKATCSRGNSPGCHVARLGVKTFTCLMLIPESESNFQVENYRLFSKITLSDSSIFRGHGVMLLVTVL